MTNQVSDSTANLRSQIEILLNNRRGYVLRRSGPVLEFFTKEDEILYEHLIEQYNKAIGFAQYD